MARTLLIRGMLVGLLAGLLLFSVGRIFGEPQVDRAIAFEAAMDDAKAKAEAVAHPDRPPPAPAPEIVSRTHQAGLGLLTGAVTYGVAFGGLFSLVFAYAYGRLGGGGARDIAAWLAGLGLLGVYVIPSLKYPSNPPAIGNPDTISSRTALYFLMLAISVVAMVMGLRIRKRLFARLGGWNASLAGVGFYVVAVGFAMLVLPAVQEVPANFSAVVLYKFRIASLGMQTVLWTTLGVVFGLVAERTLGETPIRSPEIRSRTLVD